MCQNFEMSKTSSRRLFLVAALLIGGACGGDDSPGADEVTVASTTTVVAPDSTPAPVVPVTEPATTEPPATEPPVTEPVATDPGSVEPTTIPDAGGCPVGTWLITTEALQEFYDVVNAAAGTTFSFAGEVLFTLGADGSFTYDMTDFTLTNAIGGVATSVSLIGAVSGTYTIVDDRFVTTIVNPDVTANVVSAGVAVDGTPYLQQFLDEFPVNNATFTCDGPDLVVDFPALNTSASVRMIPA
jgi:hypothetical protein